MIIKKIILGETQKQELWKSNNIEAILKFKKK